MDALYAHAHLEDLALDARSQWVGKGKINWCCMLSATKQAISIKLATKVGLFFMWPWPWLCKHLIVRLVSFFLCAVFSYFHTTGCEAYSLMVDGYGIFNVRINLGACRTHEGGSGTKKSAQELTRRHRKLSLTLPHQGIEPSLRILIPTL